MFCYKIGICGVDLYYSIRLMEYFNGHEHIPLKASVFSSDAAVREYLKENSLDLLVTDNRADNDICNVPTLYFSEQRDVKNSIFKYQSAEAIAERIINYLRQSSVCTVSNNVWIGVYSPVGRCGKTTLARKLAENFKHSLYVGLEDFPSCVYEDSEKNKGETFLYYLASRNEKVLELVTEEEGFEGQSLISTVCHMERQVSIQSLIWFKKLLIEKRHYNAVIFDLGIGAVDSLEFFDVFDKILVPVPEEEKCKIKAKYFGGLINKSDKSYLAKKIKYITLSNKESFEGYINEMIEKGAV